MNSPWVLLIFFFSDKSSLGFAGFRNYLMIGRKVLNSIAQVDVKITDDYTWNSSGKTIVM